MDFSLITLVYSKHRLERALRLGRYLSGHVNPKRCIVVINGDEITEALVRAQLPAGLATDVVHHDNTGLEFGGYQRGLDLMADDLPDRLLVMNDTVGTHDLMTETMLSGYLRRLRLELNRFVVGKVDETHRRLLLEGLWTSRWIRSHLFGVDRSALAALDHRFYHPHLDALVRASADPDRFFGPGITGGLRDLIAFFLFQPSPWSWYAAQPLSEENCEAMASKARAILQEKYLSMKFEATDTSFWGPLMSTREHFRHRGHQILQKTQRRLKALR